MNRISLSYATAQKLGFKGGRSIDLRTFYFMVDGRCVYDCAFCTHARNSKSDLKFLSRVAWFEHPIEDVLKAMKDLADLPKRLCFQIVSSIGYHKKAMSVVKEFIKFGIPISVNFRPRSIEEVEDYIKLGVDKVGIAMDAATREIFGKTRDGRWEDMYGLLKDSAMRFPGKIVTHLIVGMGEDEEDAKNFLKDMKSLGVNVGIFGFTPMKGTKLEHHPPVDFEYYRRIKAWYLKSMGMENLDPVFAPTGCPDCDKPFYDVSPSVILKKYKNADGNPSFLQDDLNL